MDKTNGQPLDLTAIRARLAEKQGPQFWRSLEEVAQTPEFQQFVEDEFPNRATLLQVDRRQFLTLMGASLVMAGLAGCRYMPQEKIVPYVNAPEEVITGVPVFYATAMPFGGYGLGALVRSNEGRPTKIEGNPDHPASLGASNAFMQASVLNLYDPDRSQSVIQRGEISGWDAFLRDLDTALANQTASKGAGLRILTETITSPVLADQLQTLLKQYPAAKWHSYEPVNCDNARNGAQLAFGALVDTLYHFDKADRIVSLDSDFLYTMPGSIRYANDFMQKRRVRANAVSANQPAHADMNRLYAVESTATITGAIADHRQPVTPSQVESFARALASKLGLDVGAAPASPVNWIDALVTDLQAHQGTSLIVPGDHQSPAVHALAHAMNEKLGAVGSTITYTDPVEVNAADQTASLRQLVNDMQADQVQVLVILGGNPVLNAPADLNFANQLSKVPFSAHLSLYNDETSARCQWHIPESHYLEAWGDVRAYDGTISIVQPLIAPLYDTRSELEVVSALVGQARHGYDVLHDYWIGQNPTDFAKFWEKSLNTGVIANTAAPAKQVTVKTGFAAGLPAPAAPASGMELLILPDSTVWDGRYANNSWLQELAKPMSKLVWDNAALLSSKTADSLNVTQDDVIELSLNGHKIAAPVYVMPGHPDNSITVTLGYGRSHAGKVANDIGFNAYVLRTADAPWMASGLQVRKTGDRYTLITTHYHNSMGDMENRDPVITLALATFQDPQKLEAKRKDLEELFIDPRKQETMYDQTAEETKQNQDEYPHGFGAYSWGMSIDTNSCIGCNACAIACQSENNIPVVGKDQVSRGREMNWIRIDRYYKGSLDNPEVYFEPVPCMHCELAPCEPVCPVGATTHSHEGINQMIYNRCVGTRYCSNNCPYKVRRFNFYNFANDFSIPVINLVHNPDVTVRSRGVMEKCSYCIQRISAARIDAKKGKREIKDGEIQTACQQACPTNAIIFGDISRPENQVAKLKQEPLNFSLLAGVNTRPRTTYLAALRNPNPDIPSGFEETKS
jgi:molybdopterin-containing oxidoreductase family iron-sulfur binding subunit